MLPAWYPLFRHLSLPLFTRISSADNTHMCVCECMCVLFPEKSPMATAAYLLCRGVAITAVHLSVFIRVYFRRNYASIYYMGNTYILPDSL